MPRTAILVGIGAAVVLVMFMLAMPTGFFASRGSNSSGDGPDSDISAGTGTDAKGTEVEAPVSTSQQVLALLRQDASAAQLERLQSQYKAISVMRPRILVLEVDEEMVALLRRDPDIVGVFSGDVPADIVGQLEAGEKLFVSAWAQQQSGQDKKRRGDGQSWDSPGFAPPDIPPRK